MESLGLSLGHSSLAARHLGDGRGGGCGDGGEAVEGGEVMNYPILIKNLFLSRVHDFRSETRHRATVWMELPLHIYFMPIFLIFDIWAHHVHKYSNYKISKLCEVFWMGVFVTYIISLPLFTVWMVTR